MRILFTGDDRPYSACALKKVAGLAMNTWADVTLMAVLPPMRSPGKDRTPPTGHPLARALQGYREAFFGAWGNDESPYQAGEWQYEWMPAENGLWEEAKVFRRGRKDFRIRLRTGNPVNEILAEAKEDGSDLIVLGCAKGAGCIWQETPTVPRKVLDEADSSVLLVKEDHATRRILAFIDQSSISQESLDMINQLVTIHAARLEFVGLTRNGSGRNETYTRLIEIGDYFGDRRIEVRTSLMGVPEFENLIAGETEDDLIAFWMEKKSPLSLLFSRDWVGRFVGTCRSSVLVLR